MNWFTVWTMGPPFQYSLRPPPCSYAVVYYRAKSSFFIPPSDCRKLAPFRSEQCTVNIPNILGQLIGQRDPGDLISRYQTFISSIMPCILISIYKFGLSVCLFVCLYSINVKKAKAIGPKFLVGPRVTSGKIISFFKRDKDI